MKIKKKIEKKFKDIKKKFLYYYRMLRPSLNKTTLGWLAWLIALLLPLSFLILWHAKATYYPRNDSANYVATTQYILEKISGGPAYAEMIAPFKPIFHPVLYLPFLVITFGKVMLTIALANCAFFVLLFLFSFLFFREFMHPLSAVTTTALLCTLGWIFGSSQIAMAELPHLASIMAALYFLKKSDYFSSTKFSAYFGVAFALGICIRPIESVAVLPLPTLLCIIESYRRKQIRGEDLSLALKAIILSFLMLAAPIIFDRDPSTLWLLLTFLTVIWGFVFFYRKTKSAPQASIGFLSAFALGCGLTTLWFLPFSRTLFGWVYGSSLGDAAARIADRRAGISTVEFWKSIFMRIGYTPLLAVLILAVIALLMPKSERDEDGAFRKILFVSALGAALFTLSLSAISANNDIRYFFAAVALIVVAASVFAVGSHRRYSFIFNFQLIPLVFLNLGVWLSVTGVPNDKNPWYYQFDKSRPPYGTELASGSSLLKRPDPLESVLHQIAQLSPDATKRVVLLTSFPTPDTMGDILGEEVMRVMATEAKLPLRFGALFPGLLSLPENEIRNDLGTQLKDYDYVLAGPLPIALDPPHSKNTYFHAVIDAWKKKALKELGLEEAGMFPFKDFASQERLLLLLRKKTNL